MHILVSGGAGFIGSHLVDWLVAQGHRVRVLDNFSTSQQASLTAVAASIEVIVGDIRDFVAVQAAVEDMEVIIHLAAMVSVVESVEQPLVTQAINATGSLHMLEAARQAGVRRIVQASSCAIYGNTERLPISEADAPCPLSPYAATKLAAEQAGQLYTHLYGVEAVALRFFNVYGPRQNTASPYAAVVPRFISALRSGQQPIIYGDGRQSRDFVFVGDIVQALWTAVTATGIGGRVFNVGSGVATSILDLATTIGDLLCTAVEPRFVRARAGEVQHSCADVSLFTQLGDFRAQMMLRAGLAATIAETP
jgi:UDP-glucose 4-epimerase